MENITDKKVWFLIIRSSNEELQEYILKPGKNILGRDDNSNVVLHDNAASAFHAEIDYDQTNNTITIRDLESTNGTFVNGKRIYTTQVLQHEDQIRIGFCIITIIQPESHSDLRSFARRAKTKVTSELILESIDHYGVLLHDVGQRLVNVPDLNNALIEISELIKRMIGAESCQIILADQFENLEEKGLPVSLAQKTIENQSATIFSNPKEESDENIKKSTAHLGQSMLLVPVLIEGIVVALIFARKSQKSSTLFYNSDLQLVLAVSNQVAMSIQRNRVEGLLLHSSTHDSLTDLPNRNMFLDRLRYLIAQVKESPESKFAVLFFDIDDFKIVNDSLGHATGDKLLVAMAERLKHNTRHVDLVAQNTVIARFGGDEFAILLGNIKADHFVVTIAERLKEILSRPFNINGKEIYTTVSIGIAASTNSYEQPEDILRDADMAMYQAKESGKNCVEIYDKAMHDRVLKRMKMGTALRRGALQKEFRLHYQPIVSLQTRRLVGYEALLRWYTPDQGILAPGEFMNAIDTAGLIYTTDQWVLENACHQALEWQKLYPDNSFPFVAVNLSARNIKHPNLVSNVEEVLQKTKLEPSRLWLEITEQVSATNDESVVTVLKNLHSLGIRISLDDFGTGYSALNYLARFPIDALKIDRSFIKMIGVNEENLRIIEILKALADQLGLILIAEGVERADQVPFLQSIDCEYVQGYYYAYPLDAESATKLLIENGQW
jgi:diguanylate cyclase (GGDEF)-like protein